MADPQQQPSEEAKPSGLAQRLKNYITTAARWIGLSKAVKKATGEELQYVRYQGQDLLGVQPVLRLKDKNLLNILKTRAIRVSSVEHDWDVFGASEVKNDQGQVIGKGHREMIEDIYQKAMIYLDPSSNEFEYRLYQLGSDDVNLSNIPHERRTIEILGDKYPYEVPGKVKIRYPIAGMKWEWIVDVGPFGYAKSDTWAERIYKPLIKKVCRDALAKSSSGKSPEDIAAIKDYIDIVQGAFESEISRVMTKYVAEFEEKHYKFVKSAEQTSANIQNSYGLFAPSRLMRPDTRRSFLYFNTYNIIQPIVYGKGKDCAKIEKILIDEKEVAANSSLVQRYRREHIEIIPWTVKKGEIGPGLDKYGYPLEVDDDNIVMIDKHPDAKGEKRNVPSEFRRPLDALEMVNYMNNFFDTYRDDLRDGRYHPGSLTINEYLQGNNKSVWGLWDLKNEDSIEEQSIRMVKLNSQAGETAEVPIKMKASDKNPAFDQRLLRGENIDPDPPWKHAGREYYYDVPDGTMKSKMLEPHISARGISMYIIEKITREMQEFDKDTIEILNKIGMDAQGFDYGTRPWSLWSKNMIPNIYNWREMIDDVNVIPTPKKTPEGYYETYDRLRPKTPD